MLQICSFCLFDTWNSSIGLIFLHCWASLKQSSSYFGVLLDSSDAGIKSQTSCSVTCCELSLESQFFINSQSVRYMCDQSAASVCEVDSTRPGLQQTVQMWNTEQTEETRPTDHRCLCLSSDAAFQNTYYDFSAHHKPSQHFTNYCCYLQITVFKSYKCLMHEVLILY